MNEIFGQAIWSVPSAFRAISALRHAARRPEPDLRVSPDLPAIVALPRRVPAGRTNPLPAPHRYTSCTLNLLDAVYHVLPEASSLRLCGTSAIPCRRGLIARTVRCTSNATPVARALHLIRRLRKPREVAAIMVWLCSDAASFVTGHPMAIDGGLAAS